MNIRTIGVLVVAIAATALPVMAETSQPLQWWQIVVGVLGIPTTILALITGYSTLRREPLQRRKEELEIRELEQKLRDSPTASAEDKAIAQSLADPLVRSTQTNSLLMRATVLALILLFWDAVGKAVGTVIAGAAIGFRVDFNYGLARFALLILSQIEPIGFILIALVFGLPLYRDIARYSGFRLTLWNRPSSND